MENIRNFCIIAHINHGKSTLADRMLEITDTIPKREMKEQALDQMELERERGITIKMAPVRMLFKDSSLDLTDSEFILNLIDTPGHIDFSYEVSRALKAVEGAILLVDATQGVQAQTISVLEMARKENLVIIPALSKIDSPRSRIDEVKMEVAKILNCEEKEIILVSGKTGEGTEELLKAIIKRIPAPKIKTSLDEFSKKIIPHNLQAFVFDFKYSSHRGVVVFVRIMSGEVKTGDDLYFRIANHQFISGEIGILNPKEKSVQKLSAGEIGYIVTGIKSPGVASVGDTITKKGEKAEILPGYETPLPVVWASFYPESQNDFNALKQALLKLKLSDSSLVFEEEASGLLGKGFRCGFLGMLHLEIISERLKREFNLVLVITSPSIIYDVTFKNGLKQKIYSPVFFPEDGLIEKILEPIMNFRIITPVEYINEMIKILYEYEGIIKTTSNFGEDKTIMEGLIPLRELMRGFFDRLKSSSRGFASLSYKISGELEAFVSRLDILINGEVEPAFSRVVSRKSAELEAERIVEKLYDTIPRQMIVIKIQAKVFGRIVSSKTLPALRKDVTQHMYGGDITRKMKLREKQKKGKKRMQNRNLVNIPQEVFIKIIKPE